MKYFFRKLGTYQQNNLQKMEGKNRDKNRNQ